MADKEIIGKMLEKVILGQQSHEELVQVFTSMAAELGVEKKAPEPNRTRTGTSPRTDLRGR